MRAPALILMLVTMVIVPMSMVPAALVLFGPAWWVWLAGLAAFGITLGIGTKLTCWAIDNGY